MRKFGALAAVLLAALALPGQGQAATHGPVNAEISVCFVPGDGCIDQILAAVDAARSQIRMQGMNPTRTSLRQALIRAYERGVDVQVIVDSTMEDRAIEAGCTAEGPVRMAFGDYLHAAGVPTFSDFEVKTAHNKLIIIDGELVIGGSYNFTYSAESRNAENVTFTWSPEIASWYLENWDSRRVVSRPYIGAVCDGTPTVVAEALPPPAASDSE